MPNALTVLPLKDFRQLWIDQRRRDGGALGGRPRTDPARQAAAIQAFGEGGTIADAAKAAGIGRSTAYAIKADNADEIRAIKAEITAAALSKVLENKGRGIAAALDLATRDPEHRNAPQSLRAAYECAGLLNRGTSIHVGDVNQTAIIVADAAQLEPAERERLEQLKRQWGMA